MIGRVERVSLLLDFYGGLLTAKQQEYMDLHFNRDMSLGEIAEEFKVSRQAVHDILKRGENLLTDYEVRLRLIERFMQNRKQLELVLERAAAVQLQIDTDLQPGMAEEMAELCNIVEKLIEQQ